MGNLNNQVSLNSDGNDRSISNRITGVVAGILGGVVAYTESNGCIATAAVSAAAGAGVGYVVGNALDAPGVTGANSVMCGVYTASIALSVGIVTGAVINNVKGAIDIASNPKSGFDHDSISVIGNMSDDLDGL